jgi:hypothetical protein
VFALNRRFPFVILTVGLPACETGAVPQRGAGSPVRDSAAAAADSLTRADSAAARPESTKIIGRDTAFGPIGVIDDSGKLAPLTVRRP